MQTRNLIIFCISFLTLFQASSQTVLLFEDFESGDFEAKGWYDGFDDQRTSEEYKNGSYSYEGHFAIGAKNSGAGRHLFTPTDKVYMSYWVKYSENYIGSGVGYHPHEWNILTNEDWAYQGPADTYLTLYIEQNAGRPILALQDSKNVDPGCILLNNNSFIGCNGNFATYSFSEYRSVASCNGLVGEVDRRDCFSSSGSTHGYYSSRAWAADSIYFRNTPGPYYKNDWHFIEAYFEMNTIEEGMGVPSGKIRYWYDGQLLVTSDSILFRTGIHPDMKFNQLFYGPYIGVGSPVDQTWWVDDLTIADGILNTSTTIIGNEQVSFSIYPNPTQGEINVRLDAPDTVLHELEIRILNILGEVLFTELVTEKSVHLTPGLSSGIYSLQVTGPKGQVASQSFIIH